MARRPEGREAIWQSIRALRCFTAEALQDHCRVNMTSVLTYLCGLTAAGYLEVVDQAPPGGRPRRYWRLVRDCGVEAPRVRADGRPTREGEASEQMWRTMKILQRFTCRDLMVHASTEECLISEDTAVEYCRYLCHAGYLARVARGGNRRTRYQFVPDSNTGPQPPRVQRIRQVWDPNLGEVRWRQGEDEGEEAQS